MSSYTPVGWATDGTHPLSQANMKTLDKGVVDVDADLAAAASLATPNELVRRDAAGRFRAVSPVDTADVATRGYVDGREGAWVLLSDTTLTSEAVSLVSDTFAATGMAVVKAFFRGRSLTDNVQARLFVNGDFTTSNYRSFSARLRANEADTTYTFGDGDVLGPWLHNTMNECEITIVDPDSSGSNKLVRFKSSGNGGTSAAVFSETSGYAMYKSSGAITRMRLSNAAGVNLAAGARLYVYGIRR